MKIFERLIYDLLTIGNYIHVLTTCNKEYSSPTITVIGNHELLIAEVAYHTFAKIATFWCVKNAEWRKFDPVTNYPDRGDKYLTSNVQILDPTTHKFEYIGKQYKYFTTPCGVRIMAFGVIFYMTRRSPLSQLLLHFS